MRIRECPLWLEIRASACRRGIESLKDLADASGISYDIICSRRKNPKKTTVGELMAINKVAPLDGKAILGFIGIKEMVK